MHGVHSPSPVCLCTPTKPNMTCVRSRAGAGAAHLTCSINIWFVSSKPNILMIALWSSPHSWCKLWRPGCKFCSVFSASYKHVPLLYIPIVYSRMWGHVLLWLLEVTHIRHVTMFHYFYGETPITWNKTLRQLGSSGDQLFFFLSSSISKSMVCHCFFYTLEEIAAITYTAHLSSSSALCSSWLTQSNNRKTRGMFCSDHTLLTLNSKMSCICGLHYS